MPKLTLGRVKTCSHRGCTDTGIAADFRCLAHTKCSGRSRPRPDITNLKNAQGIELEVEFPVNMYSQQYYQLIKLNHNSGQDCSLNCGIEYRIVDEATKAGRKAAHLTRSLKEIGANMSTRCGLHVHMDLREFSTYSQYYLREKLLPKYKLMEAEINSLFPERRKVSCQPLNVGHPLRYSWINVLYNNTTSEIRIHPGTLNPDVMLAWTTVCRAFQKVIVKHLKNVDDRQTNLFRKGKFIKLFNKGTIARDYLECRKSNPYNIERDYRLHAQNA